MRPWGLIAEPNRIDNFNGTRFPCEKASHSDRVYEFSSRWLARSQLKQRRPLGRIQKSALPISFAHHPSLTSSISGLWTPPPAKRGSSGPTWTAVRVSLPAAYSRDLRILFITAANEVTWCNAGGSLRGGLSAAQVSAASLADKYDPRAVTDCGLVRHYEVFLPYARLLMGLWYAQLIYLTVSGGTATN